MWREGKEREGAYTKSNTIKRDEWYEFETKGERGETAGWMDGASRQSERGPLRRVPQQ